MNRMCALTLFAIVSIAARAAEPEMIDIPGVVTDAQGNPVAGAEISFLECEVGAGGRLNEKTELARTKSDVAGRFAIKGMKTTTFRSYYWIRATADKFAYGGVGLETYGEKKFFNFVRQRGEDEAWIILAPAEKFEGTIVDETGAPVAGAVVYGDESRRFITTGADGKFAFDKAPSATDGLRSRDRQLYVTHPDFVALTMRAWSLDGNHLKPGPQTIKLDHGVKITGQAKDRDTGRGLSKIGVSAQVPWVFEGYFRTSTEADGRYTLRVPAPPPPSAGRPGKRETEIELNVASSPMFDSEGGDVRPVEPKRKIVLADGDETVEANFEFQPDLVLRGTIRTDDGSVSPKPIAVKAVPVPSGGDRKEKDGSVKDSRFAVPGLDPGAYELSVIRASRSGERQTLLTQQIEIKDMLVPLALVLPKAPAADAPAVLHGTLRDARGNPVKLGKVNAYGDGFPSGGYCFTDLAGQYDLPRAGPNTRSIWAWNPTGEQVATIEVPEGFDLANPLDLALHPAAEISGLIHDPDGKPLEGIQVSANVETRTARGGMSSPTVTTETGADGRFTLKGAWHPGGGQTIAVSPRPYIDRVEHYNHTIAARPVPADLAEGQNLEGYDFTIDLSQPVIKVTADAEK